MNVTEVLSFDLELELTEGLNKGHAFYISYCPTKLEEQSYFIPLGLILFISRRRLVYIVNSKIPSSSDIVL